MPRLEILVIDHQGRGGAKQLPGPIIQNYVVYPDDELGARYADYCALYRTWRTYCANGNEPEMLGFFGYRKYLCDDPSSIGLPAHAPNFWQTTLDCFNYYRRRLAESDGTDIKALLAQYDVLQGASFEVDDIIKDFATSRSQFDAEPLGNATGWQHATKIYPYLFITRWSVFDRMMSEMEPIRRELDPLITAYDSKDMAYKERPMAYIMERVYSFWLAQSGLSIKEVPLLHCWEL